MTCPHPSYNVEPAGDINFPGSKAVCSRCGTILLSWAGTFPIGDEDVERAVGRRIPTEYEALGLHIPLSEKEIQEASSLAEELDPEKDDRLLTSDEVSFVERALLQDPFLYDREDLNLLRTLELRRRGTRPAKS